MRRGHVLADAAGEERAALEHRLAVQRGPEDADELRRDERIEHDRHLAGGRLGGAEEPRGPLGRLPGRLLRVEVGRGAPDREAEAGVGDVAVVGQGADRQVGAGLAAGRGDAGARRHGALGLDVGVVGLVDPDPAVRGEGQPLELLGQSDLVRRGHRQQLVAPQVLLHDGARRRARPGRPTRRVCRRSRCRGPRPTPRPPPRARGCRRRRSRSGRRARRGCRCPRTGPR